MCLNKYFTEGYTPPKKRKKKPIPFKAVVLTGYLEFLVYIVFLAMRKSFRESRRYMFRKCISVSVLGHSNPPNFCLHP
jgi:hypothetical protein